MFCSKCGTKNEKDAKFCSKCGEALNAEGGAKKEETVVASTDSNSSNAGGIRKAMKADAKKRVKGSLVAATAIYLVVCAVIGAIFGSTTTTYDPNSVNISYSSTSIISELLVALIGLVFSFGLIMVAFKAIKDEKYEFSDVFLKPFEKMKFLGYIILLSVITFAITFVGMIIPIIGWIALLVAYIYYAPVLSVFVMVLADPKTKEDISFGETFKKALEITKGNRVEYYGIICSFIGWALLSVLTFGILMIWLLPYMQITFVNMYQKWSKENEFKTSETGLSNGAVIGITAGGCGCGCLIFVTLFAALVAAAITAVGIGKDNPSIQSFIDKYIPEQDRAEINNEWNNIIDDYNSTYNS